MRILWLLCIAILFSCKGTSVVEKNDSDQSPIECMDPVNHSTKDKNVEQTSGSIIGYEVIENMLFVSYNFSGCVKGSPVLYFTITDEDSPVPTINLELSVLNAGMCDQLLDGNECFLLDDFKAYGRELKLVLNSEEVPEHLLF